MWTRAQRVCSLASLGFIALSSFWLGKKAYSQSETVVPQKQALTAFGIEKLYKSAKDPQPTVLKTVYARKSNGSTYTEVAEVFPDASRGPTGTITDTQLGTEVILHPGLGQKTTYHYGTEGAAKIIRGLLSENCEANLGSPAGSFAGHPMNLVETVESDGLQDKRWILPDLNCFTVKESYTLGGAVTIIEVTKLVQGEPPEALFEVPAALQEASPKEVDAQAVKKHGKPFWGPDSSRNLEDKYKRFNGPK